MRHSNRLLRNGPFEFQIVFIDLAHVKKTALFANSKLSFVTNKTVILKCVFKFNIDYFIYFIYMVMFCYVSY